jgi:hypothetical protein
VTYIEGQEFRPLEITSVMLKAENIRNVESGKGEFPSPVFGSGIVFHRGRVTMDGDADFLRKPTAAVRAEAAIEDVELNYFAPVVKRLHLVLKEGRLGARGRFEYSPASRVIDVDSIAIDEAVVDYLHTADTVEVEHRAARAVTKAANEATDSPDLLFRVKELRVNDSVVGFVNGNMSPPFRLWVENADMTIRNVSNQSSEGRAVADLRGRFTGSGPASLHAEFQPGKSGTSFDAALRIEQSDLRALNDVLRARLKLDVVGGKFSLWSEVSVKNGVISGYVKPLFEDVDVYDKEQDRDKNFFRKAWEKIAGGLAKLLENRKTDEVATVATLSGRVDGTTTNTLEVLGGLIRNAFLDAILPGFEREALRRHRSRHDDERSQASKS